MICPNCDGECLVPIPRRSRGWRRPWGGHRITHTLCPLCDGSGELEDTRRRFDEREDLPGEEHDR